MNNKEIYTDIYKTNYWVSNESRSGGGSEVLGVKVLIRQLPALLSEYKIKSILDIPCGDFNWAKEINWDGVDYLGADIVDEMIKSNIEKYVTDNHHLNFAVLDLINDELPKVDLVMVKDCFIHFSFSDTIKVLENVKRSGSKYLLTSNGENIKENINIETGGGWRGINLELPPYNMPRPIDHVFNLYLWEISKL